MNDLILWGAMVYIGLLAFEIARYMRKGETDERVKLEGLCEKPFTRILGRTIHQGQGVTLQIRNGLWRIGTLIGQDKQGRIVLLDDQEDKIYYFEHSAITGIRVWNKTE